MPIRRYRGGKRSGLRAKRKAYKPKQYAKKYNYRSVNKVKDVKKVIRNYLAKNSEVKFQSMDWDLNPLCLQSGTAGLSANYAVLNPSNATFGAYSINRGTGSGQMIGDKIRMVSAVLDYVVTVNNYNATFNSQLKPTYLCGFIYKYKKAPQNDPQVTNICGSGINTNFFDIGTSDTGFFGNLEDLNQRMNTDAYIYYAHRTWKLGAAISPSGATQTPVYTYSNNDFKLSAFGKWNVTRYLPKVMTRDDSGTWMDDYIILLFQVLAADGTVLGTTQSPLNVKMSMTLKYTDS